MTLQDDTVPPLIDVVCDGAAALDYLFGKTETNDQKLENQPDFIILDIKLPKLDGIDVLSQIKKDNLTRHIPVVVFSSSSQRSDIDKCYELGVNSYVIKPVAFDEYATTIKQLGNYWQHQNISPN